jgi:hypothetical protein
VAPAIIGAIILLSAWADFIVGSSDVMQYPLWSIALVMAIIAAIVPLVSWMVLPNPENGADQNDEEEETPLCTPAQNEHLPSVCGDIQYMGSDGDSDKE